MPVSPTYPGVYIEELPSGVHTIVGVSTSNTAFVGIAQRGDVNKPVAIFGTSDFDRYFGGLWKKSLMSYAVRDFFANGGTEAFIVRVVGTNGSAAAAIVYNATLKLKAKSVGAWGNKLWIRVDDDPASAARYTLTIRDVGNVLQEQYTQISIDPNSPRSLDRLLKRSNLVVLDGAPPTAKPPAHTVPPPGVDPFGNPAFSTQATNGADGDDVKETNLVGDRDQKSGIYALLQLQTEVFNLLCIPPIDPNTDLTSTTLAPAAALCQERRAMLIVDPSKDWQSVDDAVAGMVNPVLTGDVASYAALFFPRLSLPEPNDDNRVNSFPPCGAVAGIFARTDAQRGVWKAPAGIDATLVGVPDLDIDMTDLENGRLNPLGVNCLRSLRIIGRVVWGSRTLRGADALADQWKYVPVRRTALYIEESLFRGLQWVVFEPNDEPLWSQIRLNVGAFMQTLFRQGAFQGSTPKDAYFVKCDRETTTQNDINLGIVNIVVGFAPLKPAEFVVVKLQQMAGQVQT